MCLCDDKYFKVINTKTGKEKLYKRAASIVNRFDLKYKDLVFIYISCKGTLAQNGEHYRIEVNSHPECQTLRRKIKLHFRHNPSYLTSAKIDLYKRLIAEKEK